MEALIKKELSPTESCIICTEPFSETHFPVALRCRHIIGHECITKWLLQGRGNTDSCPFCRQTIFEQVRQPRFDDTSLWSELCEQRPERIHEFVSVLWSGIFKLCKEHNTAETRTTDSFTVTEILDEVVFPALTEMARGHGGLFHDCHSLISASWNSLGRPNTATGLAIPLVRLVRLMSQPSSVIPKWLTSLPRISLLFFRANACLPDACANISWTHIQEAAKLTNTRYFPLLHLYTVIMSQTLVHLEHISEWPEKRYEIMNLVLERCVKRVGEGWEGRPGNEFKDVLVRVYKEMWRWQGELGNKSLRGIDGEEFVVRGFWAMAGWERVVCGKST
ncbi:hypothetical protein P280DRAFT_397572 [Massarina eburnea CBS 473.64]|uniref:RING-type domain-containing protein n=1 Tax=Massarina eburnea CBS 473.64 TaxID=1395130 RepID=A0A6A6S4D0_9PLEO|nr:hypothetical protein P280DRAFT_397572 [Massarina eburnea CBS 473.64]